MIEYLQLALRDLGFATKEDLNTLTEVVRRVEQELRELQMMQRENLQEYHPPDTGSPYAPKKEK